MASLTRVWVVVNHTMPTPLQRSTQLKITHWYFDQCLLPHQHFGLVHLNSDNFFKLSPNRTGGHGFKLYKQFSSSNVRSSFFAQRVVNVWNSLPTSVDFSTLSAFKRSLQRVNLNEFLTVYKFSDMYDCV